MGTPLEPPAASESERRSTFRTLLDEFALGWNAGEPERMAGVFAADAAFKPGPFDVSRKGREAILGYWRDVPASQTDVSFRYGEIFSVGPWFATEFRCTYTRRRTGETVDVRGALFCETKDGKIGEMRMYWERRAGGG
jgi:ketosteroid isomerase-like protein